MESDTGVGFGMLKLQIDGTTGILQGCTPCVEVVPQSGSRKLRGGLLPPFALPRTLMP